MFRAPLGLLACLLLAMAAWSAAWPGVAVADDTSAGRDVDGVYPIDSPDVEMASENVTIELFRPEGETSLPGLYSRARCEFSFRSRSPTPQDVLMAFPAEVAPDENQPEIGDMRVRDFKAFVKGPDGEAELPVALEPTSEKMTSDQGRFSTWYTFTVHFEPGETKTVVNTYWVKNTISSNGEAWVSYVLETGRNWAGPIGEATVTLKLGDILPAYVDNLYPGNWRFTPDGRSLVWRRTSFEPSYNLVVRYNVRAWDGHADTRPERQAELEKLFADGPGLTREELVEAFKAAVDANDLVKAAVVRGFLPDEAIPAGPPELTGVTITKANAASVPLLSVGYADPDGDIVALHVRADDFETNETSLWMYAGKARGNFQAFLGDKPAYQVDVTIEDAGGLTASLSELVPVTTPQAEGTTSPQGAAPAESAGTKRVAFPLAWAAGGVALAAIAGVAVVLAIRRSRRSGRSF